MNRINSFDWMRVIALLGILACHSMFLHAGNEWLGRYLGQTCNLLFLILSAFLMGLSWERGGYQALDKTFVTRRLRRLSHSYYPYLVVLFVFCLVFAVNLPLHKIAAHVLYLPWFDAIDGFGHLWYLTMIVICYVQCWVFSRIGYTRRLISGQSGWLPVLLFCCAFLLFVSVSTLNGVPGAIFLYAMMYPLVFGNASKILRWLGAVPLAAWLVIALVVNAGALMLYYNGLFEKRLASYFVSVLTMVSLFGLMLSLFRNVRPLGIVTFVSTISFEVYLVHEFFISKAFNVYSFMGFGIGYICLILLSVWGGVILYKSSGYISKISVPKCKVKS